MGKAHDWELEKFRVWFAQIDVLNNIEKLPSSSKIFNLLFAISSLERSSTIEATKEDGSKTFGDSSRTLLVMCSGKLTRLDLLSLRKIILLILLGDLAKMNGFV